MEGRVEPPRVFGFLTAGFSLSFSSSFSPSAARLMAGLAAGFGAAVFGARVFFAAGAACSAPLRFLEAGSRAAVAGFGGAVEVSQNSGSTRLAQREVSRTFGHVGHAGQMELFSSLLHQGLLDEREAMLGVAGLLVEESLRLLLFTKSY
jgi:hypothetical protein